MYVCLHVHSSATMDCMYILMMAYWWWIIDEYYMGTSFMHRRSQENQENSINLNKGLEQELDLVQKQFYTQTFCRTTWKFKLRIILVLRQFHFHRNTNIVSIHLKFDDVNFKTIIKNWHWILNEFGLNFIKLPLFFCSCCCCARRWTRVKYKIYYFLGNTIGWNENVKSRGILCMSFHTWWACVWFVWSILLTFSFSFSLALYLYRRFSNYQSDFIN